MSPLEPPPTDRPTTHSPTHSPPIPDHGRLGHRQRPLPDRASLRGREEVARSAPTHSPDHVPHPTARATLNARPHALYRLLDPSGQLLYVGLTVDPGQRLVQHRGGKPWWSEVATITVEQHPDRASAMRAEAAAIAAESPRYNIAPGATPAAATSRTAAPQVSSAPGGGDPIEPWEMPDQCEPCNALGWASTYWPFRWGNGVAHYQCRRGHFWRCWWRQAPAGDAFEWRGMPTFEMQIR